MNYKAVQNGVNVHASVNGVVSSAFAWRCTNGTWAIMIPQVAYTVPTQNEAIRRIATAMGDWYTAAQAAERLVELGAFSKRPSAHDVCMWARNGLLPGAIKITGKGGQGQGGSWRIPEAALAEFAKGRRER